MKGGTNATKPPACQQDYNMAADFMQVDFTNYLRRLVHGFLFIKKKKKNMRDFWLPHY